MWTIFGSRGRRYWGVVMTRSQVSGRAQVAYLEAAVAAARSGEIAGIATAPISKAAAQSVGFAFPGHTEFLAERFSAPEVAMMFAGPKLKVVLATVHEALYDLPKVLTSERITLAIRLAAESLCRDFGKTCPLIGVLGLNPHAGEGGRFGNQEAEVIEPAIVRIEAGVMLARPPCVVSGRTQHFARHGRVRKVTSRTLVIKAR